MNAARRAAHAAVARFRESRGRTRLPAVLLAAGLLSGPSPSGPFDIALFATPVAPAARGAARLVYAESPFGIAVAADGRARFDVQIHAQGLPAPSGLGAYSTYVAWEVAPDLSRWNRLGAVTNGSTTVGHADMNKFLLVITAEASSRGESHHGPTVLHGTSPSGWLQSFLTHPMFRGITG